MTNPKSYFESTPENPYHLSVGVVLTNEKGEVACEHLQSADGNKHLYILVRETVGRGESLEQAAKRGLKEELGMVGEPMRYLGALQSEFPRDGATVEKTTIYLLYRVTDEGSGELPELERHFPWIEQGTIEWLPPGELAEKMRAQRERLGRSDLDESEILERI